MHTIETRTMILFRGIDRTGKTTLLKHLTAIFEPFRAENLEPEYRIGFRNRCLKVFAYFLVYVSKHSRDLGMEDPLEHSEWDLAHWESLQRYSGKDAWILDSCNRSAVKKLWLHDTLQWAWRNRAVPHHIPESLAHFMHHIDRIGSSDWEPTWEDYLFPYTRTTGVITHLMKFREIEAVDFGGSRNLRSHTSWVLKGRNRWTCTVFVASATDFAETLLEDQYQNRWEESLNDLRNVVKEPHLRNGPIFLVLNKIDVLVEKLQWFEEQNITLDNFFPELGLGTTYKDAYSKIVVHLMEQLESCVPGGRVMGRYVTSAVKQEATAVMKSILHKIICNPELRQIARKESPEIPKFALVGAPGSGKSTFIKQALLHTKTVNLADAAVLQNVIHSYVGLFFNFLDTVLTRQLDLAPGSALLEYQENRWEALSVREETDRIEFLRHLWKTKEVQEAWGNQSNDCRAPALAHFVENLEWIYSGKSILPADFLRATLPTSCKATWTLSPDNKPINLIDYSSNRAWLHDLDDPQGIVFVASVSEVGKRSPYDERLSYWEGTVLAFKELVRSKEYQTRPIILLLNKVDELTQKIQNMAEQKKNLNAYFPELRLRYNYDFALETILEHYQGQLTCCAPSGRILGCYCINSLDPKICTVFEAMVKKFESVRIAEE